MHDLILIDHTINYKLNTENAANFGHPEATLVNESCSCCLGFGLNDFAMFLLHTFLIYHCYCYCILK